MNQDWKQMDLSSNPKEASVLFKQGLLTQDNDPEQTSMISEVNATNLT